MVAAGPEAGGFALAGGGALVVHGLTERSTNDLDFFIPAPTDVPVLRQALETAFGEAGFLRTALTSTRAPESPNGHTSGPCRSVRKPALTSTNTWMRRAESKRYTGLCRSHTTACADQAKASADRAAHRRRRASITIVPSAQLSEEWPGGRVDPLVRSEAGPRDRPGRRGPRRTPVGDLRVVDPVVALPKMAARTRKSDLVIRWTRSASQPSTIGRGYGSVIATNDPSGSNSNSLPGGA